MGIQIITPLRLSFVPFYSFRLTLQQGNMIANCKRKCLILIQFFLTVDQNKSGKKKVCKLFAQEFKLLFTNALDEFQVIHAKGHAQLTTTNMLLCK